MKKMKHGFVWVTLGFFLISFAGHWVFGWSAFAEEARAQGQPVEAGAYVVEMMRDTLENWQSEFLQLIWQVVGLAFLLHVGSSQSKESDERLEKKLDFIMSQMEGGRAKQSEIDRELMRQP
jgi:hypothetical protein